jgi:hypothetical protein
MLLFHAPLSWLQTRQRKPKARKRARPFTAEQRLCSIERLEDRTLLAFSTTTLSGLSVTGTTEFKPQSKTWEYNNTWYTAVNRSEGVRVSRLDGNQWTAFLTISGANGWTDVKVNGDQAFVLIQNGTATKLATLQYQAGSGTYSVARVSSVPLPSAAETATIDIDSTGRMWMAYDESGKVQVRYSDGPYTSWSSPITLATGINSDDITVVTAMPNNKIAVLWSNQSTDRFGFRTHSDGNSPTSWTADEVPASQSALNVRGGMADDHLNVAVASDGTLYAAVKTSYDTSGYAKIALLVRRPSGAWDNLYYVDDVGTRPIVVLNEAQNKILVMYDDGPIYYRESSASTINFGSRQTLISSGSNLSSSKQNWTDDLVVIAGSKSVRLVATDGGGGGTTNTPPVLASIGNKSVTEGQLLTFTISATDADGDPLTYSASSLPSGATFNASTRTFSWTPTSTQQGTYNPRFTVSDGQATDSETITITVFDAGTPNSPPVLATIGNKTVIEGQLLSFTISATDADNNPLTYSAANLPSGATFNASTRTFSWTPTTSQQGQYSPTFSVSDGTASDSETITITVLDGPGITVSPTSGLKTTEAGGTATFTVMLTSRPTDIVTIAVSSSDTTEGTVNKTSLTFTTSNWNVAQTVIVTGVDDSIRDGNINYTIILSSAVSTDPDYNNRNPADVQVTNQDNEKGPPPKSSKNSTSTSTSTSSTGETMLAIDEWIDGA